MSSAPTSGGARSALYPQKVFLILLKAPLTTDMYEIGIQFFSSLIA